PGDRRRHRAPERPGRVEARQAGVGLGEPGRPVGRRRCHPAGPAPPRPRQRINAASRADPVAGLDICSDDLNCYAGKVEYYQWKLVGEGKVLAPVLQPYPFPMKSVSPTRQIIETPYMTAGYEKPGSKGAPWWIQENLVFVVRPVWIV